MLPTDARGEWDAHLLNDPRVTHLWDGERVAGRFFGRGSDRPGGIEWDAYFLFDRGARWDGEPDKRLGWGRTVIGRSDDLEQKIAPLLG